VKGGSAAVLDLGAAVAAAPRTSQAETANKRCAIILCSPSRPLD